MVKRLKTNAMFAVVNRAFLTILGAFDSSGYAYGVTILVLWSSRHPGDEGRRLNLAVNAEN